MVFSMLRRNLLFLQQSNVQYSWCDKKTAVGRSRVRVLLPARGFSTFNLSQTLPSYSCLHSL